MEAKKDLEIMVQGGIAINAALIAGGFAYLAINLENIMDQTPTTASSLGLFTKAGLTAVAALYTCHRIKEINKIEKDGYVDAPFGDYGKKASLAVFGLCAASGMVNENIYLVVLSGIAAAGIATDIVTDKLRSIYHSIYGTKEKYSEEIQSKQDEPILEEAIKA